MGGAAAGGLMLLEETAFNTNHVARFLEYRFGGFFDAMGMGINRSETAAGAGAAEREFRADRRRPAASTSRRCWRTSTCWVLLRW
ncbi:MAG: hypothetical protein R3E65_10300 [Steroidobacteraceae bacterium]